MDRVRLFSAAVLLACAALAASAKSKPEPFVWPALPDSGAKQTAAALKNDAGLVVIDRKTKVSLASFGEDHPGIRVDEFVRLFVVNEDGVHNPGIPVVMTGDAKLELIEGRTVAADGSVTALDEKKDVVKVDTKNFGKDETLTSSGTVHFPAPQVGSILDLHYVSFQEGNVLYYYTTLLYDGMTTVKGDMEVTIRGGLPETKWSILSFGDSKGLCRLEALGDNLFAAHIGTYEIETRETNAPPALHTSPILLCYLDWRGTHLKAVASKVTSNTITLDARGRVQGFSFPPGDAGTEWWVEYLKKDAKRAGDFIKRTGTASDIAVDAIAPPSLPMEERLAKLYRHAQSVLKLDPYAGDIGTLSQLMDKGASQMWEGTLLFAYLLDRARIEYHFGLVSDRKAIRFSPVVRNGDIYSFMTVVIVPRPGKPPLLFAPGDFSLDYGTLPYEHQDALVFWLEGEDGVRTFYSSVDDAAADAADFHYSLEMDAAGLATGSVTLSERGAKSRGFRRWYILREIKRQSPRRDKDQDKSAAELKQELDEEVSDRFWTPGDQFAFSEHEMVKCVQDSTQPLELKAHAVGKGIGQANGDRWLILANPLLAGFSNPFLRPVRRFAIWNPAAGRRTMEGELLLPAGAKVVELPTPKEVKGPEGLVARYSVEQIERDGRVLLKSRVEYTMPLILGSTQYGPYKSYLDAIAKMGQDRCIVQIAAAKELE